MIVALTGATGVVGGAILGALQRAGHRVRALVRAESAMALPATAELELSIGALEDGVSLRALANEVDAVVHCAFADVEDPELFIQANIAGTLRLLTLARQANVPFVYVSSTAVYGDEPARLPGAGERPLDEDFTLWPREMYGAHKLAMEKMVVAAGGCAFRLGCVLSAGDDGYLAKICREAQDGAIRTRLGAYVITDEDAAAVIAGAVGDPAIAGTVFNTFDRWLDFADLAAPIATALGRDVEVACAPAPAPRHALRNDRLLARGVDFRTDERLAELLAQLT